MQTKTVAILSLSAFFGVIFAVNGTMIALSMSGENGLVVDHEYNKALHYDDVVQQQKRQAKVGWHVTLTPPVKTLAPVSLTLTDKGDHALDDADVTVSFQRPTAVGLDQTVALTERAPGQYVGEVHLVRPGLWDAVIDVKQGEERYHRRQRIYVEG